MKNLSLILNGVLAVAVAVLFYLHFKGAKPSSSASSSPSANFSGGSQVIAFVNIDTLEAQYAFFQERKSELEKKQKNIESILQREAEALQRELYQLQEKASTMTRAEGEAAQERMMRKQYDLENKKNQLTESFISEQTSFNSELNLKLDSFLAEYNKDKKYSYILSYAKGGSILYKDEALDITKEVIEGMNAQYKAK